MTDGRTLARILAVALLFAAGARAAAGQDVPWTTRGPVGGSVFCLVPDPSKPSTIYAGTGQGVFKSTDGGSSWKASGAGMPSARVQTIVVNPAATATLYAGTVTPDGYESLGIFKSTDGGASWAAINNGLVDPLAGFAPLDVEILAIDPRNPETVLAGTRFSEIFKSTDGGATWIARTLGGINVGLETSAFQFDPSGSSRIYAASTSGLLLSTDRGETWGGYGNAGVSFFSLAIDPTSAATLYAGNVTGLGIYKSIDSGAHWSAINKNLPVNQAPGITYLPLTLSLLVDPAHPSTVYAGTYGNGVFASADGGSTWAPAVTGMRDAYVWALAFASGQSSTLYAGTAGGGVYQSLDGSRTWTSANAGLNLSFVSALVSDAAVTSTLYAGAFDGVYKSTDGGASWQAINTGLPVDSVSALALEPGSPKTLFAATFGGGLFKSSDAGATWSGSAPGLADSYISSIAVDPTNPLTLYAGTAHPYDGTNSERVYKSTDGGSTWTRTSLDAKSFSMDFIGINSAKPAQVVAVSQGVIGYYQSLDAGTTWSVVSTDFLCGGVNAILFDAAGSTTYLAGNGGLCRSTDQGKTWLLTPVGVLASVRTLTIDPANPSTFYAGASPSASGGTGGVFRSTDGGATWTPLGTGLSAATVTSLVLDPQRGLLHAGIDGGGVAEFFFPQSRPPVQTAPSSSHRTRQINPH